MGIIDKRVLFEVEFGSNTMQVLAMDLNLAVQAVLFEQSLDSEYEDSEYLRVQKMKPDEVAKATIYCEESDKHLNLVEYIKKEINTGDSTVILSYTEV